MTKQASFLVDRTSDPLVTKKSHSDRPVYQLCEVDKKTNRVTNFTYQPKRWFIVLPVEVVSIGYLVSELT